MPFSSQPSSHHTAAGPAESSGPSLTSSAGCCPSLRIERIGRTIIFLGAPTRASVAARHAGSEPSQTPVVAPQNIDETKQFQENVLPPATSSGIPQWRLLPLHRQRIPTGFTQRASPGPSVAPNPSLDINDYSGCDLEDASLRDSTIAEHRASSPIRAEGSFIEGEATVDLTSFSTATSTPPCFLSSLPPFSSLTDLEDLPGASYITSMQPQTITITTIVGILSISPPRQIPTKYGPRTVINLVVGDETSTGLKVNVWIPNKAKTTAAKEFTATVFSLRSQDVVLIKNLALCVWGDTVEAQTLSKDQSKIELIYRVRCFDSKERRRWRAIRLDDEHDQQVRKVSAIVKWVRQPADVEILPEDTFVGESFSAI